MSGQGRAMECFQYLLPVRASLHDDGSVRSGPVPTAPAKRSEGSEQVQDGVEVGRLVEVAHVKLPQRLFQVGPDPSRRKIRGPLAGRRAKVQRQAHRDKKSVRTLDVPTV
uniref:(northern house mosquito) hypothetical protein n=1 Tax=Culex pipiens TaxID=7175 RepID=A0A8D8GXY3_CULPI